MLKKNNASNLPGLAAYLVADQILAVADAEYALMQAKKEGLSFTQYVVKHQLLTSCDLLTYCATTFALPTYHETSTLTLPKEPLIKPELIYRYRAIPLKRDDKHLYLGISDPTAKDTFTAISFHTELKILPLLIAEATLESMLHFYCPPDKLTSQLKQTLIKISPTDKPQIQEKSTEYNDEPVTNLVDRLILDALEKHVSDIHIEPQEKHCRVRYREDGLLREVTHLPPHLAARVIMRLKVMANLNIAERRLPQDGRLTCTQQELNKVDIRMNTCPTLFGEKIVLRLLNNHDAPLSIQALGFSSVQEKIFIDALIKPQGLILVTGPTGSGKTISLYSALTYLNRCEKNIVTIEDPIEMVLPGINQVTINPAIGLNFPSILQTFLRQDPDIIMVGEIRDKETATLALQAAQTGHLVLSTLHTNSAVETLTRLQSMGIAAFHLIDSIQLIMAQRLVRKLCLHCKQRDSASGHFHAHGCSNCHQGYAGRTGIFELLPISTSIAELILTKAPMPEIRAACGAAKLPMLRDDAMIKVAKGETSLAEIIRVLGPEKN